MTGQAAAQPGPKAAVRLIFEYEGDAIRLVSTQQVEMTVPPSDPLEVAENTAGFWIEVRDANDQPLYRRVMHNPVRHDVEVFSDDPQQSITRVPAQDPRGSFAVLVPAVPGADHVAVVSSPLGSDAPPAPASEIARFAITLGTEEGSR